MPHTLTSTSRRKFLRQSSAAATGLLLAPSLLAVPPQNARKLGVAILGLGGYASGQIAPALQLTEHCELAGLITGSPDKLPEWQREYGIADERCYTYDTMERIADDEAIDVVYVITPTATHKDFVLRAAAAGKHVWCEKPMAMNPEECQAMIDACERAGVKLAIGYRMLHEPNTRKFIALTQNKAYGALKRAEGFAGYAGSEPDTSDWRGQRDMGGGALYDMGVYSINGLRYATGMVPEAVVKATQERPTEVDVTTSFTLRFPGGLIADGATSVLDGANYLRVEAERGWYQMKPMQPYQGVVGSTSDGEVLGPAVPNQQSIQMDDDARAILAGAESIAPGREGLIDVAIIRAIIESAESGKEVSVSNL